MKRYFNIFTNFNSTRSYTSSSGVWGRTSSEIYLRCTVIDERGQSRLSGKFRKSDLCMRHSLNPRDLRKVDSRIPNIVPTILARREATLINILHVRALVKRDTVLLFEPHNALDTRQQSVFLYNLEHSLKDTHSHLPYEFRAIEAILQSVIAALGHETDVLARQISDLLLDLEDDIEREKLKNLLHYARKLSTLRNRATLTHEAIEEVLKNDEDLSLMYLSDREKDEQNGKYDKQQHGDHDELELLLESASKQIEEIVTSADALDANVSSTQEIVELILDSNRNNLLALDLKVSIATLGIGAGTLFAGLFGMNLQSHLEENPYAFFGVSLTTAILSSAVTYACLRRLARIRRIKLGMNAESNKYMKKHIDLGAGGLWHRLYTHGWPIMR
ncbi:hypothetical protein J056_003864 [Wallemia ichthyophaga EXF-994]|uniref:Magnesium transporter n=2 Tax=Wallemia ichthyophaga TaxID=245174 RepID=A0A4T0J4K1_WALIC|nr:uncharacterized protein J056_003864 [Wallemia ichthyophaga EXF-994]EOR01628.1 hypothetical protein J056_003864 [Wallemia ichthyophaga EXF-994]TIA96288.1 hypothetical protein E3P96_03645 [Wallemia ichthyophaga]TIB37599.1 hypothetical protein E3P86_02137 [Wallemia ichthyophaga]